MAHLSTHCRRLIVECLEKTFVLVCRRLEQSDLVITPGQKKNTCYQVVEQLLMSAVTYLGVSRSMVSIGECDSSEIPEYRASNS